MDNVPYKKIKVVIADDHPIVLVGIRELMAQDKQFEIVGQALCSERLVALLEENAVDILLTDYNMPGNSPYGDGLKLISYLRRHFPTLQILVLTMISNQLLLARLHELGVAGVIQKNYMHQEIRQALSAAALISRNGGLVASPKATPPNMLAGKTAVEALSLKEMEVLRLFVSGKSVSDIARFVNRSSKTISTQKISAMRKLHAQSDQDLLTYCIGHELFK